MDGTPCAEGGQALLYGWDRDALPFRFPEGLFVNLEDLKQKLLKFYLGVGIAVGKNTPYKYLIVNTHYLPIVKNDYSGNQFLISRKRFVYTSMYSEENRRFPFDF